MTVLQLKRGTSAQVLAATLKAGELAVSTTDNTIKIGNGTTVGGVPLRVQPRLKEYIIVATAGTTFTLTNTYFDYDVYINGVCQVPGYSYTLNEKVLTFAQSVPVGTVLYVVGQP